MKSRTDLRHYKNGIKKLKHFIPASCGPVFRPGVKLVHAFPDGEACVAMTQFPAAEVVLLATSKGLYVLGTKRKIAAFMKRFNVRGLN